MALEILEGLGYFAAFWTFVLSNDYRTAQLHEFRNARWGRLPMLFQALVATVIGLAPLLIVLLLAMELLAGVGGGRR